MDQKLLSQVRLFQALPEQEVRRLAAMLRPITVAAETILFYEGESGDHCYIVLDGEIEIVKALGTPDEQLLGIHGPGEFIGEMSLIDMGALRVATARARTPAMLVQLTHDEFDTMLRTHPAISYDIIRMLSGRLRVSTNMIIGELREKNRELREKNRELTLAYDELRAAQAQIIEKETLERELRTAHDLQQSMLPRRMPRLPGFVFGARLAAARAVSGDFFDFIPLGNQQLGIVVGDVCGKGMPAAIYMALTRSLIRAEAPRCLPPGEALYCVNRHLLDIHDGGMFVTLVYGVLACDTGQFVYARAGHELPLLRSAEGPVYEAPHGLGHPLGILDEPQFDEQILALDPGATLLLYTDGVSEAMNPSGELFGRKHLAELLEVQRQGTAQKLCDDLLETILAFEHNEHPTDDVTVVAVRAQREGEP